MSHAYPRDLASFVLKHWSRSEAQAADGAAVAQQTPLPPLNVLEEILSTSYQASLLVDEQRPVTFRLIFCEPVDLPSGDGPPQGLHRLLFDELQPFTPHDLRRLSPAATFDRSLIGICLDGEGELKIWGIAHSGVRWLRPLRGGRAPGRPLPPALVICTSGRGRLEVCRGSVAVAQLNEGRLLSATTNVFDSHWLPAGFAQVRSELIALHSEARERSAEPWATLDGRTIQSLGQNIVKRIIATIRTRHHGGMVIFVDPERAQALTQKNPYLSFKYGFKPEEPQARFRTLLLKIMNALAALNGGSERPVGWREYEQSNNPLLATLDEALFETAHFVADLAAVDGAVVMTRRFELLGFGGFIACDNVDVRVVARALDLEGEQVSFESTASVGTRHRSAYRLCHQLHDAMAIVVSQDGNVRFVRWNDGFVTCWSQQTLLELGEF
ncbi:putative sensor domain DACNV-containing protein [Gloeobacter morelensis]|uniref:DNA integrity scanning protein DisA nucleotide-binding domain protein n=1 Tax=Gloeobacter morelensis MG652769 TaxID=2781736 RepID=A0ABY3PLD7_9CYAN|nr:diadenylate cyclase [Gloeobacter morelensis]UFP94399.1 DNA integrity scanning protein DisA nucleotide-binding domain protein [Gloeobacter morelensis MG652769]